MTPETDPDARESRLAEDLGQAISYAANESILFKRLEEFFCPHLANLWCTEQEKQRIEARITELSRAFGGPPSLIGRQQADPVPRYDMYLPAAFTEVFSAFWRAQRSIARAHTFFIAAGVLKQNPEVLHMSTTSPDYDSTLRITGETFWEHAETGFVRLASFWDRVGQVLDFVFFSIRQFERDGFSAVLDRIRVNHVPLRSDLRDSIAWIALRRHQSDESDAGLKWLLRRRNLVVHSLSLRPLPDGSSERNLFDSEYNHLEAGARDRLAPGSPQQELERVHGQLQASVRLFPHILELCEQGARRRAGASNVNG